MIWSVFLLGGYGRITLKCWFSEDHRNETTSRPVDGRPLGIKRCFNLGYESGVTDKRIGIGNWKSGSLYPLNHKYSCILNNSSKFRKLVGVFCDVTLKKEGWWLTRSLEFHKKMFFSKEIYYNIRPVCSQRPQIYWLQKIHKVAYFV